MGMAVAQAMLKLRWIAGVVGVVGGGGASRLAFPYEEADIGVNPPGRNGATKAVWKS